jgi:predicted nucleic acid-binding protein
MIVISDTTPINYLVLIGQIELLRGLYENIIIPQAVHDELCREETPASIRQWIGSHPDWLEVRQACVTSDPALLVLGEGEREAITLAEELRADLLVMDDRDGRREALRRGLRVTGLLGVLDEAAARGLINLPQAIQRLQQTSFRASPQLLQFLLDRSRK